MHKQWRQKISISSGKYETRVKMSESSIVNNKSCHGLGTSLDIKKQKIGDVKVTPVQAMRRCENMVLAPFIGPSA